MSKHWRSSTRSGGNSCVEVSLPQWRKSTRSQLNGCVEVSLPEWRKSSRSSDGACVEVAFDQRPASLHNPHVLVRDSKDPHGPVLTFTAQEWAAFLAGVRDEEFDLERA
jgi:hypothetical protein